MTPPSKCLKKSASSVPATNDFAAAPPALHDREIGLDLSCFRWHFPLLLVNIALTVPAIS